jgi:hypothetical protein
MRLVQLDVWHKLGNCRIPGGNVGLEEAGTAWPCCAADITPFVAGQFFWVVCEQQILQARADPRCRTVQLLSVLACVRLFESSSTSHTFI